MKPEQQSNYWQHDDQSNEQPNSSSAGQVPVVTLDATPMDYVQQEEFYQSDQERQTQAPLGTDNNPIQWEATEYVQHDKDIIWFLVFGVVVLGLMAAAILLLQSWSFAVLVAVMAASVVVYSMRPPRILRYTLSSKGVHVGEKLYAIAEFKSFGIVHDGTAFFIMLVPNKRFMPAVSIYFPEESGEAIVDALGSRLPMQDLKLDFIDVVVRKLRL